MLRLAQTVIEDRVTPQTATCLTTLEASLRGWDNGLQSALEAEKREWELHAGFSQQLLGSKGTSKMRDELMQSA